MTASEHQLANHEVCASDVDADAGVIYRAERQRYHARIDKLFIALFIVQWPASVALAFFMTPTTWAGSQSSIHLHVYLSVGLGAVATLFPAWLAWKRPGAVVTRHVIAAATMIFTAVFIHLSGGRDEGHFHFFMMMAFVALYFDWRVVLTAIVVGAIDHVMRTLLFPMSVFGVLESPWFQLFRHVLWVVFEGSVLVFAAVSIDKDKCSAARQVALGQHRETRITALLEENQSVSAEREKRECEALEAAEAKQIAEQNQRKALQATAERESKEAEQLQQQVQRLLHSVNAAARGNLTIAIGVKGDDAIGQVGSALQQLLLSFSRHLGEINASAQSLTEAADELDTTSQALKQDASETTQQVEYVALSATDISTGVQSSAASTEQMSEAIREVSRCASEAVTVGQDAVVLANEATNTVQQLAESSSGIGNVLKVITSIAEQTNLLALNATIEAARAGDAGKGFAVVANEVKDLAKETARATDEISLRVGAIQTDASNAGAVISQISDIIKQIDDYQTTVAAAVEQQTATTKEISMAVRNSAQSSEDIRNHISGIANRAASTKQGSEDVQCSAESLGHIANRLKELLSLYDQHDSSSSGLKVNTIS